MSLGLYRSPVPGTGSGDLVLGPGIVEHTRTHFPFSGQVQAGQAGNFRVWYRDPLGPCGSGFNLTNALAMRFAP